MTDQYKKLASTPIGKLLVKQLGLPNPVTLRRYRPGQPLLEGPALVGGEGRLTSTVTRVLGEADAHVLRNPASGGQKYGAVVFDATGITDSTELRALHDFVGAAFREIGPSGRLLVLGTPPEHTASTREYTAQRALEGFVRTAGKELKHGATAQLVYVTPGAENSLESTLRFLLSAKSAYVSGQVVRVGETASSALGTARAPQDWERPLDSKVAVVTGAARGIGAAIAHTLARDGAHVICLDVPAQGEDLSTVANDIGGSTLQLDITAEDAGSRIAEHVTERHGGVDVVVHNAGITRDKTIARMKPEQWDAVLGVNLAAQERINDVLLGDGSPLRDNGRIIGVSSIAGIAGNVGQGNYGTSKAGVIGVVHSHAPVAAERGATVNAVAPGFIETEMTAAVPLFVRQAGRWMNSMSQGGIPVDVAETIAWFANPASSALNGNVVRVCGQSLLGA